MCEELLVAMCQYFEKYGLDLDCSDELRGVSKWWKKYKKERASELAHKERCECRKREWVDLQLMQKRMKL